MHTNTHTYNKNTTTSEAPGPIASYAHPPTLPTNKMPDDPATVISPPSVPREPAGARLEMSACDETTTPISDTPTHMPMMRAVESERWGRETEMKSGSETGEERERKRARERASQGGRENEEGTRRTEEGREGGREGGRERDKETKRHRLSERKRRGVVENVKRPLSCISLIDITF